MQLSANLHPSSAAAPDSALLLRTLYIPTLYCTRLHTGTGTAAYLTYTTDLIISTLEPGPFPSLVSHPDSQPCLLTRLCSLVLHPSFDSPQLHTTAVLPRLTGGLGLSCLSKGASCILGRLLPNFKKLGCPRRNLRFGLAHLLRRL
ncbi:hypothetical protein TgHK011_000911 [Trichoderma gracile]|nr:hypothetical protein TgHK011_000911 [Trichoderma gracile]